MAADAAAIARAQVASCLKNISALTKLEVQRRYGFPQLSTAAALRRRAADMLGKGFEWTLQHGWPRNPLPARYKWAPPCCEMQGQQARPDARPTYECVGWDRGPGDLPKGDPYFGGPWREKGRDTGTYELRGGGGGAEAERKWSKDWVAGAWLGDDDAEDDPGYAPAVQANMYNR